MKSWKKHCTVGFLFLGLTIAGCDTAWPGQPLIGTWSLGTYTTATYLTATTSQQIIDPAGQGAGVIVLTGDLDSELSHLRRLLPSSSSTSPLAASIEPLSEHGFFQPITGDVISWGVKLIVPIHKPNEARIVHIMGETPYVLTQGDITYDIRPGAAALTVNNATFVNGEGETVMADGSLEAAVQTLPANEATRVGDFTIPGHGAFTLTLDEDGTFTAKSSGEPTSMGTWDVGSGELLLSYDGSENKNMRFSFEVTGDRLILERTIVPQAAWKDADRRAVYAAMYGAADGTISKVEMRDKFVFAASSSETGPEAFSTESTVPLDVHLWK